MPALGRWTRMMAAVGALAAGGCGGGDGASPPDGPPQVALTVQRVFPSLSFAFPVAMLQAPNDASRWFVVEQGGVVRVFNNNPNVATASTFVDISARVTFPADSELGLLGMAFHPQFSTNRSVYLFYSHNDVSLGRLVSRLSEFTATPLGLTLDPTTERVLLTIPKPNGETNHNGGNLAFGPDGFLYAGLGDGGGGNDNHGAIGNAQSTNTVLGKMLRINVLPGTPGAGYSIPLDNPFASNPLCSTDDPINRPATQPCPEIFALGFRNPYRWSFDRGTGQLWVGDVGQGAIEEVDRVDLGDNFGWRCFEGNRNTGLGCGAPGPTQLPVAQYGRDIGTTVIGGFVYRGSRVAGLVGRYIFGDFTSGRIFNIDVRAQPVLEMTTGFPSGLNISSFGEAVDGELFVVHYGGQLFQVRQ
jgi:glucose/arabinose dehydrogenase